MADILLPTLKLQGYVIVNPATGLFSSGSCDVKFKKKGKVWSTLGHVKSHITMLVEHRRSYIRSEIDLTLGCLSLYKGCKVYEIGEGIEVLDVWDYAKNSAQKMINSGYMKSWKIVE